MLSAGQVAAAVIPFLAAPVLGRLYTPADYGVLGTLSSLSSVLGTVGNWQLSQAIIIERRNTNAAVLRSLCIITSCITGLLTAVGVCLFLVFSSANPLSPVSRAWILLLPLTSFISGYSTSLNAVAVRFSLFKRIGLFQSTCAFVAIGISLGFAKSRFGGTGLILAYAFTQLSSLFLFLALPVHVRRIPRWTWNRRRMLAMLRKHKGFTLYTLPTSFVGMFTMNTPIYALSVLHADTQIGLFTRANQLMSLPANLIGSSIAQVFQQRAASDFRDHGSCWPIYKRTFLVLLGIGALPALLFSLFAPTIFGTFLGPKWTAAGGVARLIAPMLILRVICNPLSQVFYILKKQHEDFLLTLGTGLAAIIALLSIAMATGSPVAVIVGYSASYSLIYLLYIARGATHARKELCHPS